MAAGAVAAMLTALTVPALADNPHTSTTTTGFDGLLYYTRFALQNYPSSNYGGTGDPVNVKSVTFSYNNGTLSLGTPTDVATVPAADGIAFTPNNDLLVGGQFTQDVYTVDPTAGPGQTPVATPAGTPSAFMIGLNPSGDIAYVGSVGDGSDGDIGVVGLSASACGTSAVPCTLGTIHVSGPDVSLDSIVFDNGQAFYTSGLPDGYGDFGSIDLSTGVETPLLTHVPFAHGATYDPMTGDLILTGTACVANCNTSTAPPQNLSEIAQVAATPTSATVVSTRQVDLGNGYFDTFDLPWVDGQGHLFAAANDGKMVFVDYARTGMIGSSSDVVQTVYVDSWLDDVVGVVTGGPHFVIWGDNQPNLGGIYLGGDYNFWGAQWWKQITAVQPGDSYPPATPSFKGYADQAGWCGDQWTADPGNSSNPPEAVGPYVSVIVTTNMFQQNNIRGGNIKEIVILKVDNPSSYVDNPGHPLTGVMVGVLCSS